MKPSADFSAPSRQIKIRPEFSRPVRILVQTKTNLVPGGDDGLDSPQRLKRMRNLICQHHWHRNYDKAQESFNHYGAEFSGHDERDCYFVIDHGLADKEPRVVRYEWTGEKFIDVDEILSPTFQTSIQRYRPLTKRDPTPTREIIRAQLRLNLPISKDDILFLQRYPGDAMWLKKNTESPLWLKLESRF